MKHQTAGRTREEIITDEVFGSHDEWNGHKLFFCRLCDTAAIICPECNNSSCNGGGCGTCKSAFELFGTFKTRPVEYLSDSDFSGYSKGQRLQRLILEFLKDGSEIQWNKGNGNFCKNDLAIFKENFK